MIFIKILWAPTVEHCKFASHIGLSIRLKLQHELSGYDSFKIDILIKDNKHLDYKNCNVKNMRKINISICKVNKQINDKERYFAAQENQELMKFIMDLIKIVE